MAASSVSKVSGNDWDIKLLRLPGLFYSPSLLHRSVEAVEKSFERLRADSSACDRVAAIIGHVAN